LSDAQRTEIYEKVYSEVKLKMFPIINLKVKAQTTIGLLWLGFNIQFALDTQRMIETNFKLSDSLKKNLEDTKNNCLFPVSTYFQNLDPQNIRAKDLKYNIELVRNAFGNLLEIQNELKIEILDNKYRNRYHSLLGIISLLGCGWFGFGLSSTWTLFTNWDRIFSISSVVFCSISFGINLKSISDLGVALKSMEILLQEVSFHLNSSKNLRDSLTTLLNVEE